MPAPTAEALMRAADQLMYAAKRDPARRVCYQVLTGVEAPAGLQGGKRKAV